MPCPCEQARGTVTCSLRVRSLPGALEDDALLEAVVLLGSLAGWQEGDRELAGSGLVSMGRQAWSTSGGVVHFATKTWWSSDAP